MSYDRTPFMLTPWVRRLLMGTAAVYLLQVTVFTHPWLVDTLGFSPADALRHPWSFLTYALLHGSFLHFLGNMIALFMFGPPVEQRLGGRRFLRLYLLAAVGGPVLSLLLLPLAGDGTIIGASAAVFGVMLAFVLEWPDAPVLIFPLPVPVKAKWLVAFLAVVSVFLASFGVRDGVAHVAHLGGFAAAFLYLRAPSWFVRPLPMRSAERAPAVLVRPPSAEAHQAEYTPQPPAARPRSQDDKVRDEVDRVLDKISERGLQSLTPDERRFLDEMSQRFRRDH